MYNQGRSRNHRARRSNTIAMQPRAHGRRRASSRSSGRTLWRMLNASTAHRMIAPGPPSSPLGPLCRASIKPIEMQVFCRRQLRTRRRSGEHGIGMIRPRSNAALSRINHLFPPIRRSEHEAETPLCGACPDMTNSDLDAPAGPHAPRRLHCSGCVGPASAT